jgi:hypothetical protein
VLVGAVNWGLWGIAQFDLVATLFGGSSSVVSRVVYSLVGLSAVFLIATCPKLLKSPQAALA